MGCIGSSYNPPSAASSKSNVLPVRSTLSPVKVVTTDSASTRASSRTPTPKSVSQKWDSTLSSGGEVLGRFSFGLGGRHLLGEGSYSTCYLGTDVETGDGVAIKEYKRTGDPNTMLARFRRQVEVLLELQEPFRRPADKRLWSKELGHVQPSDLFVRLLDYSKDTEGNPGRDSKDGSMYVVTELAEHTLKQELRERRQRCRPLSTERIRQYTRQIVLAVAGLHAKGFVHMDIKPDNIMRCGGRWKLIDMDGCSRADATISTKGSTVSFSPVYCAPEFARFISKGDATRVSTSLDAWSVGLTLAELVSPEPVWRADYERIAAGLPPDEGARLFLKWLGGLASMPELRRAGRADSAAFLDFLESRLLVADSSRRTALAKCLSAPFLD